MEILNKIIIIAFLSMSTVDTMSTTLIPNYESLTAIRRLQNQDLYLAINKFKNYYENEFHNNAMNSMIPSVDDTDNGVRKSSVQEIHDLDTAAGTNVLRPLFVYRQQLAYRDRVKKGVARRFGIRPRF
ncbi:PREDICTED: uncharacterized protein LOC105366683 [Ceratosolen solmsi marchali]|uniref:Uncharacterized protein LOC105366683 n=1 Tax=Ceratosolen solmsi marchali TaxID=326594 RepID=A0AAJ7E0T2_9HYME|nr:PREDICTED: uncharacterized protein LOC105366683 [Ceratosolen solmsi marchali]